MHPQALQALCAVSMQKLDLLVGGLVLFTAAKGLMQLCWHPNWNLKLCPRQSHGLLVQTWHACDRHMQTSLQAHTVWGTHTP